MSVVLICSDDHGFCRHPSAIDFLIDTWNHYNCDTFVHIGDVVDNHMSSKHTKNMKALGTNQEAEMSFEAVQELYNNFPDGKVCIGNHDLRPTLRAAEAFVADRFMREYADVWETPGWDWQDEHEIDGVGYVHGFSSGKYAAFNLAKDRGYSMVMGHTHKGAGVYWMASPKQAWFGLNVGCLVDPTTPYMDYAKRYGGHKPVLGCGVVIDGEQPTFVKMELGAKGRYRKKGKY